MNIRFNPEKDRNKKTEEKDKEIRHAKKRKRRWYFLIPLVFLVFLLILFIGWRIAPDKKLNICLLDKTILLAEDDNDINIESAYRKHQGFYWILEQQKYVFEDGTPYDYTRDYFGPMLDETGQYTSTRELSDLDYAPDLMYVADLYGAVDDTYGYYDGTDAQGKGMTADDMTVVSYAHESGAVVVAEMELFNSGLTDSIYSQMQSLCGVKPTTWVGRYIFELQDFTDVPDWAPPMYEQQEGVEWQFSGPGILLVSSAGKIIILEQKTDFESKNLLQIYVNKEYKEEFGSCRKCNFYNWFELVEADYNTEVLATFEFDVNATGMEKLKEVTKTPRFVAVTRKTYENKAPVYYFAGDFNDYVNHLNYNKFLLADYAYRSISYDRQGDISNFFWNFYTPLMKKILSDAEKDANHKQSGAAPGSEGVSRIQDGSFLIRRENEWEDVPLKALRLNATEPGADTYSRDFQFYQQLVQQLGELGANCVQADDLFPPEFYRAVYNYNQSNGENPIYILQTIRAEEEIQEGMSEKEVIEAWKKKIATTLSALHGNGTAENARLSRSTYFIDVSEYLLGVLIDGGADPKLGKELYHTASAYHGEEYGYSVPVGILADPERMAGCGWSLGQEDTYDWSKLAAEEDTSADYYFTVVSYAGISDVLRGHSDYFTGVSEEENLKSCVAELSGKLNEKLLVTGVCVSNHVAMYGEAGGVSEKEQGQRLVALLKAVEETESLGVVAADLNDDWSAVSDSMYPYTVPLANNCLWQNVADPAQMTGVLAVEAKQPEQSGINLTDDDRLQQMSLSANESYLYLTVQLLTEIEQESELLFIGLDTYQRNDGEYYYASDYTPTALSGMEFVIRFEDKQTAGLYVISSYDRSQDGYTSLESYSGEYRLVAELNYGGFSTGENQFYQTGSTIYIRIPWSWLNVTDPSQKVVLNNPGELKEQAGTVNTNGILTSVMIGDRQTKDLLYIFPEKKQDPGYKVFKWSTWDTCTYNIREKDSFSLLQEYFSKK